MKVTTWALPYISVRVPGCTVCVYQDVQCVYQDVQCVCTRMYSVCVPGCTVCVYQDAQCIPVWLLAVGCILAITGFDITASM